MNPAHFAQAIRQTRLRRGLKQRELAIQSGLPVTFVNRLEHGKLRNPTLKTLRRLAKVLDVPVGELLGERAPTSSGSAPRAGGGTVLERGPGSDLGGGLRWAQGARLLQRLWDATPASLAHDMHVYEQQPGLQALADDAALATRLLQHEWDYLKSWAVQRLARHGGSPTRQLCEAELRRYRRITGKLNELVAALNELDEPHVNQVIDYVRRLRGDEGGSDER